MDIIPGIEIVDLALYLKKQQALILADLHVGYEESLNRQGILVPRHHYQDLASRLESILDRVQPKRIVVLGDLKHEFGRISDQEWREALRILELLGKKAPVNLVRGNHDTICGAIARKKDVKVFDQILLGDVFLIHGHRLARIPKPTKTIIIGHEHPAVSLQEGSRTETFKCFLKGRYKDKDLIVMPSLNLVVEGTDVIQERHLSPFLSKNDFSVFVAGGPGTLFFGSLKNLKRRQNIYREAR